jgi:hypothetical protein
MPTASLTVKGEACGPEGCAALRCQGISDDALISHGKSDTAASTVEFGTGIVCPICATAQNFKGRSIVQIPGNRSATNSDAAQGIALITGKGELAANRRDAVPMVLPYKLLRRP